jgi:hypothetical protein
MSKDDSEEEQDASTKYSKTYPQEIENQSLEDIFPNLEERPKQTVEKENVGQQMIETFFPALKGKIKHPEEIPMLIRQGIISDGEMRQVREYFRKQLKSPDENVRLGAWHLTYFVTSKNLISNGEMRQVREYFLDLLKSGNELIRANSWWIIDSLLEMKIVSKKEVKSQIMYLFELGKSRDYWGVVSKAQTTQLTLIDKVITEKEYDSYLEKQS